MSAHKIRSTVGVIIIRHGAAHLSLLNPPSTPGGNQHSQAQDLRSAMVLSFLLNFLLSHKKGKPRFLFYLNICFSLLVSLLLHSPCFSPHPPDSIQHGPLKAKHLKSNKQEELQKPCSVSSPFWKSFSGFSSPVFSKPGPTCDPATFDHWLHFSNIPASCPFFP